MRKGRNDARPRLHAASKATEAKGKQKAVHHWTLLQRLPRALLTMVLRLLPLAVFIGAASALMSIFTDDGTPQDRALDSLIDIYVLCRLIVIGSGFFLQPTAPRLRLLRMSDAWAVFVQRWIAYGLSPWSAPARRSRRSRNRSA